MSKIALSRPNKNTQAKAFGCLALLIGGVFSILIQSSLFGSSTRFNLVGAILAPAWVYFDPGRDDGVQIILATVIDTVYYAAIIYFAIRVALWLSSRFKIQ